MVLLGGMSNFKGWSLMGVFYVIEYPSLKEIKGLEHILSLSPEAYSNICATMMLYTTTGYTSLNHRDKYLEFDVPWASCLLGYIGAFTSNRKLINTEDKNVCSSPWLWNVAMAILWKYLLFSKTSQSELTIYLEATWDLRLLTYCVLLSLFVHPAFNRTLGQ